MPLVFDVYGTLLDIDAAARDAAVRYPKFAQHWQPLSIAWRQRQLSYTWLRSMMGDYASFWQITENALDVTLAEMGLDDADLRRCLLDLYLDLPAYTEVTAILAEAKAAGHKLAVLSNGNSSMLEQALQSAGIRDFFDVVLSVDVVEIYKPAPQVYSLATKAFDCAAGDIKFFSSNHWDISGAGSFGFTTFWVNRGGRVWDDIPKRPDYIAASLSGAMAYL